ncbi:MAG: hypothetical protein JWQ71_2666 [Pedosphaera sp.]|nr:hypothetical protein [Pedosphaera sp.]
MPRGSSPKREREYTELEHQFEKSGRYGGRAKEVAARIVNKQRARFGETKKSKSGNSSRKTAARKTSTRKSSARTTRSRSSSRRSR